ncbi:MAG: MFS transporter, partial [Pseudomonadota bacterium]
MSVAADRQPRGTLTRTAVVAVVTLGITQIISWGTTFYALGVLAEPIRQDTGWSLTTVYAGATVSLLAAALVSTWVGRKIDQRGARLVMTSGSIAMAGALVLIAVSGSPLVYLAAWALAGVTARLTQYDAAFAALVQIDARNGRRLIAYLTLFGGFASSVFWPIGHVLAESYGWRGTFFIFAGLNLLICVPLHWFCLPAPAATSDVAAATGPAPTSPQDKPAAAIELPPLAGVSRTLGIVLFSIVMGAYSFVFGVGAVHLVGILEASGVALATAVALGAFKGVAQVIGRVGELVYGHRLAPLMLGRVSIALLPLSFLPLLFMAGGYETALAFVLVYGISNGLMTIVRGAV